MLHPLTDLSRLAVGGQDPDAALEHALDIMRGLLGADARLTTSLLRGDDCSTFHIKPHEADAQSPR